MVYGTVISNSIILGAIVSVSAMLSSSGPSPSSTAPPPPGPLSIPGGAPLLQGKEHTASSLVILLERLTRCSWASCCMLIVVRVLKRVLSAVYHPL